MSYARLSDKSDLYVYLSVGGWLECCGCSLSAALNYPRGKPEHYVTRKTAEMLEHVEAHRVAGHKVPDYLEARLLADAVENDAECAALAISGDEARAAPRVTVGLVASGLGDEQPPLDIRIDGQPIPCLMCGGDDTADERHIGGRCLGARRWAWWLGGVLFALGSWLARWATYEAINRRMLERANAPKPIIGLSEALKREGF